MGGRGGPGENQVAVSRCKLFSRGPPRTQAMAARLGRRSANASAKVDERARVVAGARTRRICDIRNRARPSQRVGCGCGGMLEVGEPAGRSHLHVWCQVWERRMPVPGGRIICGRTCAPRAERRLRIGRTPCPEARLPPLTRILSRSRWPPPSAPRRSGAVAVAAPSSGDELRRRSQSVSGSCVFRLAKPQVSPNHMLAPAAGGTESPSFSACQYDVPGRSSLVTAA